MGKHTKTVKQIFLIIIAVALLAVVGFFILNSYIYNENPDDSLPQAEPEEEQTTDVPQEQKEELASSYIEANISDLSPEPEVLGGTFYVTNITFAGPNSGTVEYEDGHIALVADFTYSVSAERVVEVEFSNVREHQP